MGKAGWLKRNWKALVVFGFSSIVGVFGSVLGFADFISQALSVRLSPIQMASFVLVGSAVVGLIVSIYLTLRNPHKEVLAKTAPFYRVDDFDAMVEKKVYEMGQSIFFEASFKGLLRAGYFDAVLVTPHGTFAYAWDPQTLLAPRHLQGGELHGEIPDYHARWSTPILETSPLGEYTAHIGIYDCLPISDWFTEVRVRIYLNWIIRKVVKRSIRGLAAPSRPCVAEKTVRFSIVKRLEDGQA